MNSSTTELSLVNSSVLTLQLDIEIGINRGAHENFKSHLQDNTHSDWHAVANSNNNFELDVFSIIGKRCTPPACGVVRRKYQLSLNVGA